MYNVAESRFRDCNGELCYSSERRWLEMVIAYDWISQRTSLISEYRPAANALKSQLSTLNFARATIRRVVCYD